MTESVTGDISPIEYLRALRDNYSDEIPEQVLHGPTSAVDRKAFKVCRNWWIGLVGGLGRLQLEGLAPPCLDEEVKSFVVYYSSDEFKRLTTAEDIRRANDLITRIVGDDQQPRLSQNKRKL